MNIFKTFALSAAVMAIMPVAAAQEVIINDDNQRSVIRGEIVDIGYDTMEVRMDDNLTVEVMLDDLELEEGNYEDFFDVGDVIRVVGHLDGDMIDATQIVQLYE